MNRIEAVFPLNGTFNKYPFDRYETTVWLLITLPPAANQKQVSKAPENLPQQALHQGQLAVGAVTFAARHADTSISGCIGIYPRHQVPRKRHAQREHASDRN